MVALEHFFFINTRSVAIAIFVRKIDSFDEIKKRISEAKLVVVPNVDNCLFLG